MCYWSNMIAGWWRVCVGVILFLQWGLNSLDATLALSPRRTCIADRYLYVQWHNERRATGKFFSSWLGVKNAIAACWRNVKCDFVVNSSATLRWICKASITAKTLTSARYLCYVCHEARNSFIECYKYGFLGLVCLFCLNCSTSIST